MSTTIQVGDRVAGVPSDKFGDLVERDGAERDVGQYRCVAIWPYIASGNGYGAWIVHEILPNNGIYPFWPNEEPLAYLKVRGNRTAHRIVPCSRLVKLPPKPPMRKPRSIPPYKIEESILTKRRSIIRPVLRLAGQKVSMKYGTLTYVEGDNLTWDPRPLKPARELTEIADLVTYHDFGAKEFFKPTVDEVLSQIPSDLEDQVVAFEVDCDDNEPEIINFGVNTYHQTITTLYTTTPTR